MHYAFNFAFTLTTLLSYQAVAQSEALLRSIDEIEEIDTPALVEKACLRESSKDS